MSPRAFRDLLTGPPSLLPALPPALTLSRGLGLRLHLRRTLRDRSQTGPRSDGSCKLSASRTHHQERSTVQVQGSQSKVPPAIGRGGSCHQWAPAQSAPSHPCAPAAVTSPGTRRRRAARAGSSSAAAPAWGRPRPRPASPRPGFRALDGGARKCMYEALFLNTYKNCRTHYPSPVIGAKTYFWYKNV